MGKKCLKCGYERLSTHSMPNHSCPRCGAVYAKVEAALKKAGADSPLSDEEKIRAIKERAALQGRENGSETRQPELPRHNGGRGMNTKQLLGLIGSILLFVGVFAPIVSVPIMGSLNYFQNGKGDGTIILIFAALSFVLVLTNNYRGLWLTGIGSLGVMLLTFINFQSKVSKMKADMDTQLAGNPFRGLADVAVQAVQLQWGWALLIVGAALVIASAAIKDEPA